MNNKLIEMLYSPVVRIAAFSSAVLAIMFLLVSRLFALTAETIGYLSIIMLVVAGFILVLPFIWPLRKILGRTDDDTYYHNIAERYGIGYANLDVICRIARDGSATVTRQAHVEVFSEIEDLDTFLRIPEAAPPGQPEREVGIQSAEPLAPAHKLVPTVTRGSAGVSSVVLVIHPPLKKGERFSYKMVETLSKRLYAIGMSRNELTLRQKPYDYFGWSISRPTRKLSLSIHFPEGVRPTQYGREVRYAAAAPGIPSERRQRDAEDRLPQLQYQELGSDSFGLKLDVDYPLSGLIYIVRWEPVAADDLAGHNI